MSQKMPNFGGIPQMTWQEDGGMVFHVKNGDGEIKMTCYSVFPGIDLIYNDIHARESLTDIKAAKAFNYSDIEELCSVGTLAFLELLNSGAYDPRKGELSTYLSPWLRGTMFRYLEKNTGALALSKHQMELIRKAQRLYHETNLAVDAVAKELGISPVHAAQLINYNTHSIPLHELYEEEQNCPLTESVEYSVLKNIHIELPEEQFRKLPARDQDILGSCLGVFGFEQQSVDKLAFEEMLTPDGIYKAKEAALERLRRYCRNSSIPLWRQAHSLTRRMARNT